MGRRPSLLEPRKVTINDGEVRWEVRIPKELRKQEDKTRRYFGKQNEAQGYCNGLKNKLRNYSDKALGLTNAQKIEAQEAYDILASVPGARLLDAVHRHVQHLKQEGQSVTLEELGKRIVAERTATGGRGASEATLMEINSRWGRFARDFPDRLASTITPEEVNGWIMGLDVELSTRHGYRRVLHTVFAYAAARVRRWVALNPVAEVDLPSVVRSRVNLLTPEQTARLLAASVPELRP